MTARETVRIGIIGAGFARTTQIPAFQNCKGAQIVALASARREHAEEVAREFNIPHVEADWRAIMTRYDVDLVSIVTPVANHLEMVLAALHRGKAVLCEKPMAMNAVEAKQMLEKSGEAGALALIDHELRFIPGRLRMRELIRTGAIGKVRHAALVFRADSRADPAREWNWWSDEKQGGGALGAIGSHVVDGFRWLLGTEVAEVLGSLATHVHERPDSEGNLRRVTTDDEANVLLRFADGEFTDGATANVSMSLVEPGKPEHRLEVFGETGALMIEENGALWEAKTGEGAWRTVEVDQVTAAPGISDSSWARGFTVFSQKIIDALLAGETTVDGAATFTDGYRTQLVLDAARRSHATGCWEKM